MIRCLVWDLDDTLWKGVLSEGDEVVLDPRVPPLLKTLDERGILHSVASKNDFTHAWAKLESFGISKYFLYPQIHWNPKSQSVQEIAERLRVQTSQMALVDDNPSELAEVRHDLPDVVLLSPENLHSVLERPDFQPPHSPESAQRRQRLQHQVVRENEEIEFRGSSQEFLAHSQLRLSLWWARAEDLPRAEELMQRTTQLNTTGLIYSQEQLKPMLEEPRTHILLASLRDRFGDYGTVGLALFEDHPQKLSVKMLLTSCRVMSKGVGGALLVYLENLGKAVEIRFVPSDRNRMMEIALSLSGYEAHDGIFTKRAEESRAYPNYLSVQVPKHSLDFSRT